MSLSNSTTTALLLISAVLLLSTTTSAFNVTHILEKYPDYSEFNSLLSKTHLAAEINRRKTITVLALTNSRLGEINGKSDDVQKRILSTHIVLDYYDTLKLNKLKGNKSTLTTLFQSTGMADGRQGFLNVAQKDGKIAFGSAVKGSPLDSTLEGSVASMPYNISVLSVSQPIIANGIDGVMRPMPAPAPETAASPSEKTDQAAEGPADETAAEAPTTADSPADAPDAEADSPTADASPSDDDESSNASAPTSSAVGKHMISGASLGLAVALVSLVAAF